MLARLRIAARILAFLVIPLAAGGAYRALDEVRNPAIIDSYWSESDDEYQRYLDQELHRCDDVDVAHPLVGILAGDALEQGRAACAEIRGSTGDATTRVRANEVERSRVFFELRRGVDEGLEALVLFAVVLGFGGLLAALGLGRIAAGLMLVTYAHAHRVGLLPLIMVASLPFLALFLACAHYGKTPRTPSDHRAATIVSLVLVPVVSIAIVLMSFNSGSGRINVRLGFTLVVTALAWFTTGVPLSVLIRRSRAAFTPPAEPPRMRLARVALSALILATAASFAGAIVGE